MKIYEANIGDLAKVFGSLAPQDEETMREIAALLGYEISGGKPAGAAALPSTETEAAAEQTVPERRPPTQERSPIPESSAGPNTQAGHRAVPSDLELVRAGRRVRPRWVSQVEAIEEDPIPIFPLRLEPLIPLRWVRSVLTDSLSVESEQQGLDVEKLVELIARRKPLLQLPSLKARTLRRGVQVLVDMGVSMEPFRRDQQSLVEEVVKVAGSDKVEVVWFEHCPARGVFVGDEDEKVPYRPPRPGSTVLLLTDLGVGGPRLYSDAASEAEWISFVSETREAGCHTVCFVPYGSASWPRALAREMALVYWGVPFPRVAAEPARQRQRQEESEGRARDPRIRALHRRNREAVELAKLLSLAARVEPELIRAARLRFLPHTAAGAEADLWFSGLVQSKSSMALLLIPNIARELRKELLADDKGRLERFWDFLRQYRDDTRASNAIRLEEQISYITLHGFDETRDEVETLLRRALKALITGGAKRSGLARWALSAIPLLPEGARSLPAFRHLLLASKLRLDARAVPIKDIPDDLKDVQWLLPSDLPEKAIGFRLLANGLEISDEPQPGMHTITVPETNPRVLELWADTASERDSSVVNWRAGEEFTVELGGRAVSIRTIKGEEYYLKARTEAGASEEVILRTKLSDATRSNSLDLSGMGLVELPERILQLRHLRTLLLNDNALTALPEGIARLTRLQTLDLSNNTLEGLPDAVGRMAGLKTLVLASNKIDVLPESVGRLTRLRRLDLSGNRLSSLPASLRRLTQLEQLYLHDNLGLDLPLEVLGPAPDDVTRAGLLPAVPAVILDYYFKTRQAKRPLNMAKLILVGRSGVGKTSIISRLVHETFRDTKRTEGIQIMEWQLRVGENEDRVRLNVWDFGGQEIMHATHQFFLTERSLYLLVLSGRDGEEDADAEYWLKLIESFGANSPVIVVLNKIKEHPFDLNRSTLQRRYPFIREFIKTDVADGTGMDELRRAIERQVDMLEHLRDSFPASWFAIMDRLAGMRRNYLSFEEFRRECERLGEQDLAAQESLAHHLHNLGIALNYRDDPRLRDTHVLNPHWVMSGIYKILNSQRAEMQKGELRRADLPFILGRRDYPPEMHPFILNLMERFELCFSLESKEGSYLIPELLDKQPPPSISEFAPEECLNFQYHYPVLPEGLLPRFIVRTHVLSDETPRWRTGVILKLEENLALVRADAQERRVLINIKGSVTGRRRLLSVIRANFDRIHGSIKNLKPVEIVPLPGLTEANVPYVELLAWEQSGKKEFEKVVDGEIITLNVQQLLNGVEAEGERATAGGQRPPHDIERGRAARVFVSYSHRDERQLNELKTHLSPLERLKLIETWYDRRIDTGEDFSLKIDENIERADIILLLVSGDFISSDYCYEREMARALERHERGEARVVPVIVRDVNWKVIPELSKLTAVPKDGRPVSNWPNKHTAWRDVSERIQAMIEAMRNAAPLGTTPATYRNDVFISYRWVSPDQEWVREQLYPRLIEAGLKVLLDVEDFVPGRSLILEMERASEESRFILCVISPEYLQEGRTVEFESLLARLRDPGGRSSTLIPLILRQTKFPNRIRDLIPIDLTVQKNHQREWKKLLRLLGAVKIDVSPPSRLP